MRQIVGAVCGLRVARRLLPRIGVFGNSLPINRPRRWIFGNKKPPVGGWSFKQAIRPKALDSVCFAFCGDFLRH